MPGQGKRIKLISKNLSRRTNTDKKQTYKY